MKAGDQIAGRWRMEASLGRGGYGEVWKARDDFGAWAVKVLHPHVLLRHPVALADFEREATITGGFGDVGGVGDHVVRVAHAGRCPTHGVHYIVMELLRGESLEARLTRRGPMPPAEVARIVDPIARVLDHAHQRAAPIVHRDLNPRNVFVAEVAGHEVVKVLDFGIARALNDRPRDAEPVLGTPQFMSPEQYERRDVTPASDVWALGLLAFTLLTGRLFFERDYPAVALDVVSLPLPRASERAPVPGGFDAWFARCVCRDPNERFASAGEAAGALRAVLTPAAAWAPPETAGATPAVIPPTMPWAPDEGDGEEVIERLRRQPALSVPEVADLLAAIGVAAASLPSAARQMGDLRPSNLRLVRSGDREEVRFAEYVSGGGRTATRPVNASDLSYVAPSALRGEAGPADDVWTLAMIAFAALARRRFVSGDTVEGVLAGLGALATACPSAGERARGLGVEASLPEGFDAWFARCTSAPAERRFRTVEQAALDFSRAVRGVPAGAAPTPSRPARRRGVVAGVVGVAVAVLIAVVVRAVARPPAPDPLGERACEAGDAAACVRAGEAYERGEGVTRDPGRAARIYERACNAGHPAACGSLGILYDTGVGVGQDPSRAARLYEPACRSGDLRSCTMLGMIYKHGRGVGRDLTRAAQLHGTACDGGVMLSCGEVAFAVLMGRGVESDPARAAGLFERACTGGDMGSCNRLGMLFEEGRGVGRDDARAARAHAQACDGGEVLSCTSLGLLYAGGHGVERDVDRAARLYELACGRQEAMACHLLGVAYQVGTGVVRDSGRAAQLEEQACGGNVPGACLGIGLLTEAGRGVERDDARAATFYVRACDGGEAGGCARLGVLYDEGRGVEADPARSAQLAQRACDGGNLQGCAQLATLYTEGRGVERDDARAVELFARACTDRETIGCLGLGVQYERGLGVEADPARAAQLYDRACNAQVWPACSNLGLLYQSGTGVARSLYTANVMFDLACHRGNLRSCANLGVAYERGLGVPRDRARGRALYEQACQGGDEYGCGLLDRHRR